MLDRSCSERPAKTRASRSNVKISQAASAFTDFVKGWFVDYPPSTKKDFVVVLTKIDTFTEEFRH